MFVALSVQVEAGDICPFRSNILDRRAEFESRVLSKISREADDWKGWLHWEDEELICTFDTSPPHHRPCCGECVEAVPGERQ